jgi:hypothetical protein
MAGERALLIDEVLGSKATDDGHHALFKVKTSGQEVVIAFPKDELINLISAAATAAKACQSIIHEQPNLKVMLPVQWWEFGLTPDGNFAVLSFRLPGGGEISFQVPRPWTSQMRETFEVMEGRISNPIQPGTLKQ